MAVRRPSVECGTDLMTNPFWVSEAKPVSLRIFLQVAGSFNATTRTKKTLS